MTMIGWSRVTFAVRKNVHASLADEGEFALTRTNDGAKISLKHGLSERQREILRKGQRACESRGGMRENHSLQQEPLAENKYLPG